MGTMIERCLGGVDVVVVEDDGDNREVVCELLLAAGATVRGFRDCDAALVSIDDFRPDVVVTDLVMPEADGADLATRLHARYGGGAPAIIVLTGRAEVVAWRLRLFDAAVLKPLDPWTFPALVGRVARSHGVHVRPAARRAGIERHS